MVAGRKQTTTPWTISLNSLRRTFLIQALITLFDYLHIILQMHVGEEEYLINS